MCDGDSVIVAVPEMEGERRVTDLDAVCSAVRVMEGDTKAEAVDDGEKGDGDGRDVVAVEENEAVSV